MEANEYKTDNKKHTDTMVSSTYLNERFAQLSSEDYTGNDKLKHKLAIDRHYKNAYSNEKEPKRERERERNEERQRVQKKLKNK